MDTLLNKSLEEIDFSVRILYMFKKHNICTVGQLVALSREDVISIIRGKHNFLEVEEWMNANHLNFGQAL